MFKTVQCSWSECLGAVLARSIFHPPQSKRLRDPSELGIDDWHEIRLVTNDGVSIHCWLIRRSSDRLAIVGHGIGQSKSASLRQARNLAELGFTVLMFDHRNHGQSGRSRQTRNMADRFTEDIETCVSWMQSNCGGPTTTTIVFGFSFSTFPSLYSLYRNRVKIDAIVCDSGPALRIEDLVRGFMSAYPLVKNRMLQRIIHRSDVQSATARHVVRMLNGNWPPPTEVGIMATTPKLVIVGDEDHVVPEENVRALMDRYRNSDVITIHGRHLRGLKDDPEAYTTAVENFVRDLRANKDAKSASDAEPEG